VGVSQLSGLENGADVIENATRLNDHVTLDEIPVRSERDLSGHEEQTASANRLRVRSDGFGSLGTRNGSDHAVRRL
jgi:hypothetical protein